MNIDSAAYNYWQDFWKHEQDIEEQEQAEQAEAIRAEQEDYKRELEAIMREESEE